MRISKGRPQFGLRETLCADSYLAPIIAAWLRKFVDVVNDPKRDWCKGCPAEVMRDYLDKTNDLTDEEWDYCYGKFMDEINEMIFAFDPGEEPCYSGGYHEGPEHGKETVRPSGSKSYRWDMQVNDEEAWRVSQDARREWNERRQSGFDLFAKRFKNLWW